MVELTNKKKTPVKKENIVKSTAKKTEAVKAPVKKQTTVKPVAKKIESVKTSVKKQTIVKSVAKKTVTVKTPIKKHATVKAADKKIETFKAPVKKQTTIKSDAKKTKIVKSIAKSKIKSKTITEINKKPSLKKGNIIKGFFTDISLIYKDFIHWNISKLLIFVWSIILGFISIIPFLIIFYIYTFYSDVNTYMLIEGMFKGALMGNFIGNLLLFGIIFIFFIIFSYSNILLFTLNNGYLDGKNIKYKENNYFDYKKIIKFLKLSIINILILLIPVLIFLFGMGILVYISGSLDDITKLVSSGMLNYFSISSLIFFVVNLIFFVYLYYRLIFSYLVFADNEYYSSTKNVIFYIKEGFNKTKKISHFFKLLTIIIILLIVTFPINYFGKKIENNLENLNNYKVLLNLSDEQKEQLTSEDLYYFKALKTNFENYDFNNIDSDINLKNIYLMLFMIFNFIFVYGLFLMILSSFYRRELS